MVGFGSRFNDAAPPVAIRAYRVGRQWAYRALEPLDFVSRLVNGKADLPPMHLRKHVGPLRTFETSGAEFVAYLKLLCGLRSDERLLDIGCGCGLLAISLSDYLDTRGKYVGIDIDRASIVWAARHFHRRPNFTFGCIDVANSQYNPNGSVSGANYHFRFADGSFDVILIKSVFTHVLPDVVDNYLGEVARLLAPGGRVLASFFLLNDVQAALAAEGRDDINFRFGEDAWRYAIRNCPEAAIAYAEPYLFDLLRRHNLELRGPVRYGGWSGRHDGLSYQDLLVLTRPGTS